MKIPSLKVNNLVKSIASIEKNEHNSKQIYKLIKNITNGEGKAPSMSFEGEHLSELPTFIQNMTFNLDKPKVTIATKSSQKGQGLIGLKVTNGDKPVSDYIIGIDTTRGSSPILQYRGNVYNADGKKLSNFNTLINTNITVNPKDFTSQTQKTHGGTFIDYALYDTYNTPAVLSNTRLPKNINSKDFNIEIAKNFRTEFGTMSPNKFNEETSFIQRLYKNKGIKTKSIEDVLPLIVKFASEKGKASIKFAEQTMSTILNTMGYDSSKIKFYVLQSNKIRGEFCPTTCSYLLTTGALKYSKQFVTTTIAHEITHMEDFIKLYKKIGAEKFGKLFPDFDKKWYKKMSKYVDENEVAFDPTKATSIELSDGTIINKKSEVKKYLRKIFQPFNMSIMLKELKKEKILYKTNGEYEKLKTAELYNHSNIEEHARDTERHIRGLLDSTGNFRHTKLSGAIGTRPFEEINIHKNGKRISRLTRLEQELTKNGENINDKFNELYNEVLEQKYPKIFKLEQKLKTGDLTDEESKMLDNIIEKKFGSIEYLEISILKEMNKRLGLDRI